MTSDSAGNIWCISNNRGPQLVKFDPRTQSFQYFDIPKPLTIPKIYYRTTWLGSPDLTKPWTREEASTMSPIIHGLATDSHNNVWYCLYDFGYIGRMDPATGKTRLYQIPDAGRIKGVEVDENDNVWLGDFLNHTLVKLDPKTGKTEKYQPPTPFASLYGGTTDKKGNLWLSDFAGSQMTRFNMATKEFTEYPLPRPDVMPRFFGIDAQGRVWYGDTNGTFGAVIPGDTPAAGAASQVAAVSNQ